MPPAISTVYPGARLVVMRQIRDELVHDRSIHMIAGSYLIAGLAVLAILGETNRFLPLMYLPLWLAGAVQCSLIYILAVHVPRAIKVGSRRPLADAVISAYRSLPVSRLVAGSILIGVNAIVWGMFSSIKNILPVLVPLWFDQKIADLDFLLHGGHDPWRLLQSWMGYQSITRVIEILYLNVWLAMVTTFPVILAFRTDTDGARIRYLATSFFILIVLGNGLAAVGMSAGPVYYGHVTGDYGRFSELVAYLSFSNGQMSSAAGMQDQLWRLLSTGQTHLGSGISAYPSIHVAMATLFFLTGWSLNRKLGAALLVYLAIVLVGSIHLGWHYGIDGYVSILGTYAIWRAVGALQNPASRAGLTTPYPR